MCQETKLNFPPINLRAQERQGRTYIFDEVRRTYIVLTPEEWVRRHLANYLVQYCGVALRSMVEEYAVEVNGMPQRADLVVLDTNAKPLLLAECKAPEINLKKNEILSDVFLQATRYNAILHARYIVITNGLSHYCYEATAEGYTPLKAFPTLG